MLSFLDFKKQSRKLSFSEQMLLKKGKSEWKKPEPQEEMSFPVTTGGFAYLKERGYLEKAAIPKITTAGVVKTIKYKTEEKKFLNDYVKTIENKDPERARILKLTGQSLAGTSSNFQDRKWAEINATELEKKAFAGIEIQPAIGGLNFVTTRQASKIIAQSVKTSLTRSDLLNITKGKLTSGVKYEAYKTMAADSAMRKELTAIAKNTKVPLKTKIGDYFKDLLKTIKVPAKPLKIPTTGKELVPAVSKVVPKLAPLVEAAKPVAKVLPTKQPTEMPQIAGKPIEDPIKKLSELIKKAEPVRGKIEKIYTAERTKRIAKVDAVMKEAESMGSEEGYAKILSQLKGELLKPEDKIRFEPIKNKLTEVQLKGLFVRTWKHPYLDNWEKINTAEGLTRLLGGEIPQPQQLTLLEEVYGSDLIKSILRKRAWGIKAKDFLTELANLPRALLATADMSGFLRQGIVEVVAHPKISAKAIGKTFKFAFSPKVFNQWFEDLPKEPLYPLMKKSGLAITDPSKAAMQEREEAFISRFLQNTPIVKIPIEFAERSYVGFLNKLRVDIFKTWSDELLSKGYSPVKDRQMFKSVATVVNAFTGRGSIGKLNKITPELNIAFFSPRLISARFNAMNPIWYSKMPKEIRMKAISDFAKFVAVGLTILTAAKLTGVDVETNPRSSDFGKIKIGNTRFDIWGGFQQWARVFAQVITGERKSTTTGEIVSLNKDEYPFTTRKEVLLRFIEGKLAPVPSLINELISGAKTFEGEDMDLQTVAKEKFIPMYIQDITDAYADGGLGRAVGVSLPAFFGVGVQTWGKKKIRGPLKIGK